MREFNLVNLTPHEIVIQRPAGDIRLPRAEKPARCFFDTEIEETIKVKGFEGVVELTHTSYNRVINLPPPRAFTIYIVSDVVAKFLHGHRDDLYISNGLIRKEGVTIACRSLGRI